MVKNLLGVLSRIGSFTALAFIGMTAYFLVAQFGEVIGLVVANILDRTMW
jgi:hypothetical protein